MNENARQELLVQKHPQHFIRRFVGEEINAVKCCRYDRRSDAFVDVDPGMLMVDEQTWGAGYRACPG
jgi:hypothetical protein